MDPSDDPRLQRYADMLRIRRFEEKVGQLYGMGEIAGFCHLSIGQEAVAVGVEAALAAGDRRVASHRAHAAMVACGMSLPRIFAELLGRRTGYSGGTCGSLHMAAPECGFFGSYAMPAEQAPIATGLAFADRYRKSDACTVAYLGEQAMGCGGVFEAFATATRFSLPLLFVVENNAPEVDQKGPEQSAVLAQARAFGLRAAQVDGMDVAAVEASATASVARLRRGTGPELLEMSVRRYRGHAHAQPDHKRAVEEASRGRQAVDAVKSAADALIEQKLANPEALRRIEAQIRSEIAMALEEARGAAFADPVEFPA